MAFGDERDDEPLPEWKSFEGYPGPPESRLPPTGRLAFVTVIQPDIARDFVLPCLCDDVNALIALVCACPALRDLVASQLTRLHWSTDVSSWGRGSLSGSVGMKRGFARTHCFSDERALTGKFSFLTANLIELDLSSSGGEIQPEYTGTAGHGHWEMRPEYFQSALTDAGVCAIAYRCPNLRRFRATGFPKIQDSLKTLAVKCPNLEEVEVGWSSDRRTFPSFFEDPELGDLDGVTCGSITMLARHCQNLVSLKLSRAAGVNVESLTAIGTLCKKLTTLHLVACPGVNDESLTVVGAHCKKVTSLSLNHCKNVHGAGIVAVAKGCTALAVLGIIDCEVTPAAVAALAKHRSKTLVTVGFGYGQHVCTPAMKEAKIQLVKHCLLLKEFSTEKCELAKRLYLGIKGEEQDRAKAAVLFAASADEGHCVAAYNLGVMYANGDGVKKDPARAVHYWKEGDEAEDEDAQFNLGCMYYLGKGVEKDLEEAVDCWKAAAAQGFRCGHAGAQRNLGIMYMRGEGVTVDLKQAARWFETAAAQGDAEARRAHAHVKDLIAPPTLSRNKRYAGATPWGFYLTRPVVPTTMHVAMAPCSGMCFSNRF